MKRIVLFAFLIALPVVLRGDTERYIVVTREPFEQAIRQLPNDEFVPAAGHRIRSFQVIDGFAADLTADEVTRLKASSEVRWIEPVIERHVLERTPAPNVDTIQAGKQVTPYGITLVNAPGVWPVTRGKSLNGGPAIHVAVIDTGIRYAEPDLQQAFRGGHNFITGTEDPLDDHGHGTHVSGTIAAADDNQGVVGVAPEVDLYGLKVLDQCGSGSNEGVIQAIDWIIQKKAAIGGNWVANLSLGSPNSSTAEAAAFQRGEDAGILFFAAAGNGYDDPDPTNPFFHTDGLSFPAGYPGVVSVGAIDSSLQVASFSQRGIDLKVTAPGVSVLSTVVSEQVATDDGRSFGSQQMSAQNSKGNTLCLPQVTITSMNFVFCGQGRSTEFPASVSGQVALIQRGGTDATGAGITFATKAKNAKAAGAVAAIIFNNVPGSFAGTVGKLTSTSDVPMTVSMSMEDGQALQATPNTKVTFSFAYEGYALFNGTSMASPHAAGVGALVWAIAPNAPAKAIANAIINTATDLGDPGVDTIYGHGLVNALEAAMLINLGAFAENPERDRPEPSRPQTRKISSSLDFDEVRAPVNHRREISRKQSPEYPAKLGSFSRSKSP